MCAEHFWLILKVGLEYFGGELLGFEVRPLCLLATGIFCDDEKSNRLLYCPMFFFNVN
jgi:hypothetical protein